MTPRRSLPCPSCGANLRVVVETAPEQSTSSPAKAVAKAPDHKDLEMVLSCFKMTFTGGRVTPEGRAGALKLLQAGVSASDLCEALWGCKGDSWAQERGITALTQILKDQATVERFRGKLRASRGGSRLTEQSRGTIDTVRRYIEGNGGEA